VSVAALVWVLAVGGLAYPVGVARAAWRGHWPARRTAAWCAGVLAATAGITLSGSTETAVHATGHVLLGMVAPLLLVMSAPVTLALRALPADRARVLTTVLRSRPARVLTHPLVAATLDVGGLWLLYTSRLHTVPILGLHVLAAGYLFTAAVVGVDPAPHRALPVVRAAALVLASAAHGILAKHLYADGWGTGAMVMYYAGDVVELTLAALLCREWLAGPQPSAARALSTARPG
jgi:putative membrane protein